MRWNQFMLLAVLFLAGIALVMVAFPPIHEAIVLRWYYTPAEIARDDVRVVEIVGKREIVFSHGQRRPYDSGLKALLVGGSALAVLVWLAGSYWVLARFGRCRYEGRSDSGASSTV